MKHPFRFSFLALVFGLLVFDGQAALPPGGGARQAGMGYTGLSMGHVWAGFVNPAALAFVKKPQAGLGVTNQFLIPELSCKSLAVVLPVKGSAVGLSLSHWGFSSYSESRFGLSVAKELGEKFAAGIQLHYQNFHMDTDYGNRGQVIAEAGLCVKPWNGVSVGTRIFNPFRAVVPGTTNRIPSVFSIGLAFADADRYRIHLETEKELDQSLRVKTGLEVKLMPSLFIRTGANLNPGRFMLGIGYVFSRFQTDMAFVYHPVLGVSPCLSFNYAFEGP